MMLSWSDTDSETRPSGPVILNLIWFVPPEAMCLRPPSNPPPNRPLQVIHRLLQLRREVRPQADAAVEAALAPVDDVRALRLGEVALHVDLAEVHHGLLPVDGLVGLLDHARLHLDLRLVRARHARRAGEH